MKERRRQVGDAHVNACWQRGVIEREPGWFFAWEGAIAVGVPSEEWRDVAFWSPTRTTCGLILRNPGAADGAH